MKKVLWLIVCLMTMVVSANAHNVHYPTHTIDGITYVENGHNIASASEGKLKGWDIVKVDKPYDKTITIPYRMVVNGEKIQICSIKENAFSTCISLDSLIISDGLYLNESTFIGCKELEYLYYSSNTSSWNPYNNKHDFYPNLKCKTLETTIGVVEEPFWKSIAKTLKKLILKENSEFIFANLRDCKNLETIICHPINPPSTGNTKSVYSYGGTCGCEKFESDQWSTITLYVPRESLEKYYFDSVWGEIDNIYAIDEMNSNTTSITQITNKTVENDVWYNLNGIIVETPSKGVYIKNGKKYIIR